MPLRHCAEMKRKIICASLLPTLILLACERTPVPENQEASAPRAQQANNRMDNPAASAPLMNVPVNTSANNGDVLNPNPPFLTPQAERGVEGARNFLLSFAQAIEQQNYDKAWSLLSPGDQQQWSKKRFAANFAGLQEISVAIPTGTTDGGAGSIYYTAPITITGTDKDGRPVRFKGEAVLRRVNDVDGATPAQLRWHFGTLTLDWTH